MNQPNSTDEPMDPPDAGATVDDGPKFGRLLIVLFFVVMLIVAITLGSEAYYS